MSIRKFTLAGFLLGLFLTLTACDPIARPYLSVNRALVIDGTPYIYVEVKCSFGQGHCYDDIYTYSSEDSGKSWKIISSIPNEKSISLHDRTNINITRCLPKKSQVCYRITGKEQVELSLNGGKDWRIDWNMPNGRREYMERNATLYFKEIPDTIPSDIGILDSGANHTVIAAMGNQGVLVKSNDGKWRRYSVPAPTRLVKMATPLSYYARNFREASRYTDSELFWVLLLSAAYITVSSMITWSGLRKHANVKMRKKMLFPFLVFILSLLGILVALGLYQDSFDLAVGYIVIFTPVVCILFSWVYLLIILPSHYLTLALLLTKISFSALLWVSMYTPYVLWAYGIIPIYSTSVWIAVILGISVIVIANKIQKRITDKVIKNLA